MQLESLKNSKFDAFQEDAINNPLKVAGGKRTIYPGGYEDTTNWHVVQTGKEGVDLCCHGSRANFKGTQYWSSDGGEYVYFGMEGYDPGRMMPDVTIDDPTTSPPPPMGAL